MGGNLRARRNRVGLYGVAAALASLFWLVVVALATNVLTGAEAQADVGGSIYLLNSDGS